MTSPAPTPDWVLLLDPDVQPGVIAAITKDPSLYSDVLRRITGGRLPEDAEDARTVAQIVLASSVGVDDVEIANAAVQLGAYDADLLHRPAQARAGYLPKGLALKFLEPHSVRTVDLALSTGDRYQDLLANLVVEKTHQVISKILWEEFAKAFIKDGWSATLYYSMVGQHYRNALNDKMAELLGLAASDSYNMTLPTGTTVTGSAKFLTPWANSYATSQIETYDTTNAQAVQESLARYMTQGLGNQEVANRLRQSYGLDPKSAFALDNYRDSLMAARPGQRGIVQKLVLTYADKLLGNRAHTISQTSAMTAMNFGRLLVYTSAMANGSMPVELNKVWLTAIDERVCPTCAPMDGVSIPMNEPFQVRYHAGSKKFKKASAVYKEGEVTELLVPPAHPNCRCTIVSDVEFKQGMITRSSRMAGRKESDESDLQLAKRFEENKHPRDLIGRFADKAGERIKEHPIKSGAEAVVLVAVAGYAAKWSNDFKLVQMGGKNFDDLYANVDKFVGRMGKFPLLMASGEKGMRKDFSLLHDMEDHAKPGILHPDVWKAWSGSSVNETIKNLVPKIMEKEHEFGFVLDETGKIVAGFKGGPMNVVAFMPKQMTAAEKQSHFFIHNHPHAEESQGFSPLSPGDMSLLFGGEFGSIMAIDSAGNSTIARFKGEAGWGTDAWTEAEVIQHVYHQAVGVVTRQRIKDLGVREALKVRENSPKEMRYILDEMDKYYKSIRMEGFTYVRSTWGQINKFWDESKHKRDDHGRFSIMGIHPGDIEDWKNLDKKQKAGLSIAMLVAVPLTWEAGHIAGAGAVQGAKFVDEHANDFMLAYEKLQTPFIKAGEIKPVLKSNLPDWTALDISHYEALNTPMNKWLELKNTEKWGPPENHGPYLFWDNYPNSYRQKFDVVGTSYLKHLPENWKEHILAAFERSKDADYKAFDTLDGAASWEIGNVLRSYHGSVVGQNWDCQRFQLAAKRALQLTTAPTLHFGAGPVKKRELLREASNWDGIQGLKLDDAIKAQYEHTQTVLKDLNIDKVPVTRGMTMTMTQAKKLGLKIVDDINDPMKALWHEVDVPLQPASSFTSSPKTAFEYAAGMVTPQRGDVAVIIRAVVDREKILTSQMENSQEWLVLGGPTKFEAVAFDPKRLEALAGKTYGWNYEQDLDKLHKFAQRVWDSNIV